VDKLRADRLERERVDVERLRVISEIERASQPQKGHYRAKRPGPGSMESIWLAKSKPRLERLAIPAIRTTVVDHSLNGSFFEN
jgi:hypothetical protein